MQAGKELVINLDVDMDQYEDALNKQLQIYKDAIITAIEVTPEIYSNNLILTYLANEMVDKLLMSYQDKFHNFVRGNYKENHSEFVYNQIKKFAFNMYKAAEQEIKE